jgi:hypothetical protein
VTITAEETMGVDRCAIGVIRRRGAEVIEAQVIDLGFAEADYFARHVEKVRENSTSRAIFGTPSPVPTILAELMVADDTALVTRSVTLQRSLAESMRRANVAKDCVFAVVRVTATTGETSINLLKLDAVIEAARFDMLKSGKITFEVLKQLLPEPGELQKGLSWPDTRSDSEVMMVDRNVVTAHYFERAFDVAVSTRSVDAERDLAERIAQALPPHQVPAAIAAAAPLSGPEDDVLRQLGEQFPGLAEAAESLAAEARPAGHVRPNKVNARKLVYRADGVEVHVPAEMVPNVQIDRVGDEWEMRIRTRSQPKLGN